MRPIRLPEPPSPTLGVPEIFENGAYSVIRRAVVIGNGFPGSENQSLGLIHALGLADNHVLYVSSSISLNSLITKKIYAFLFLLVQLDWFCWNFHNLREIRVLLFIFRLMFRVFVPDRSLMQRVTRPSGGINEWLRWLPVSLHKILYSIIMRIYSYSRFIVSRGKKLAPLPSENRGSVGLSSILEADSKQIVNMARESYEK